MYWFLDCDYNERSGFEGLNNGGWGTQATDNLTHQMFRLVKRGVDPHLADQMVAPEYTACGLIAVSRITRE